MGLLRLQNLFINRNMRIQPIENSESENTSENLQRITLNRCFPSPQLYDSQVPEQPAPFYHEIYIEPSQSTQENDQNLQISQQILHKKLEKIVESPLFKKVQIANSLILLICCIIWVENQVFSRPIQIVQTVSYSVAGVLLLIKIVVHNKFQKKWLLFDFLTLLFGVLGACNFQPEIKRYFKAVRTLRLVFLIKDLQFFSRPTTNFFKALTRSSSILVPMALIIYIYAVIGLYAFSDYEYNRCRAPHNINQKNNWTLYQQEIFLCGEKDCPIVDGETYQCLNPVDYGVQPNEQQLINIVQGNGLLKYSNIFYALLSTFKQTVVTGSSRLITIYKQALNPYFVFFYFYTYIYIISYICLNIFYSLIITSEMVPDNDGTEIDVNSESRIEMIKNQWSMKQSRFSRKKLTQIIPLKKIQKTNFLCVSETIDLKKNSSSSIEVSLKLPSSRFSQGKFENIFDQPDEITEKVNQSHEIQSSNNSILKSYRSDEFQYNQTDFKYESIPYHIARKVLIALCCINLCLEYHQQHLTFKFGVDCLDVVFYCLFILDVIARIIIQLKHTKSIAISTRLQIVVAVICTGGMVYQACVSQNVSDFFMSVSPLEGVFRSFKYLRLFILLIESQYFEQVRLIFVSTLKAVFQIRNLIGLWFLIVCIFSIAGYHLHSNKTKINQKGEIDLIDGQSFQISLDSIFDSFIFTLLTFYNEEWDLLMFQQYLGGGAFIILWQLVSIFVGVILISKYFMVLLMKELNQKYEKQKNDGDFQESQDRRSQRRSEREISVIKSSGFGGNKAKQASTVTFKLDDKASHQKQQSKQKSALKSSDDRFEKSCLQKTQNNIKIALGHNAYKILFAVVIFISCGVIAYPHQDLSEKQSNSILAYQIIDNSTKIYFLLDVCLNTIVYGLLFVKSGYLRKNWLNLLNICIVLVQIISLTTLGQNEIFIKIEKIRALRIVYLIYEKYKVDPNMRINLQALWNVLPKIGSLLTVIILIEGFFAILLLKIYKNEFYSCENFPEDIEIVSSADCYNWGGDWIQKNINVSNFLDSLLFLFLIATTQGWYVLMTDMMNFSGDNLQPVKNANKYISIFFVCFFFFASMILLNVFLGLSIFNFKELKEKQTGQASLNCRDKVWWSIKTQIHRLSPIRKLKAPQNIVRRILFNIVTNKYYLIFQGLCFLSILISMSIYQSNMENQSRTFLNRFQKVFAIINIITYLIEMIAFGCQTNKNKIFLIFRSFIVLYSGLYVVILQFIDLQKGDERILGSIFIALQFLRYLGILFEVPFIQQQFNTLFTVLPSTANIFIIMIIILYIYSIIGIQFFRFLRPNLQLDSFNQNYMDFPSAIYTLIKFSTMQSPIQQISDAAQSSTPSFICFDIYTYGDYLKFGQMGCGNKAISALFFITFHVIYSLLLMSTLMAVIADSYSEVKLEEETYVNKFLLYEVRNAWAEVDQQASGFIPYRQFWGFTIRLIKIYDQKLLKTIQKEQREKKFKQFFKFRSNFLEELNLKIYEDQKRVLSLQFHQVIEALTINYLKKCVDKSFNLEKTEKVFRHNNPTTKKTKPTGYTSAQISSLILLKSVLRKWNGIACNKQTLVEMMLMKKMAKQFLNG